MFVDTLKHNAGVAIDSRLLHDPAKNSAVKCQNYRRTSSVARGMTTDLPTFMPVTAQSHMLLQLSPIRR